jgi:hypothetical protein
MNEPPNPIPDTGKLLGDTQEFAFNFGILKPWESDTNTGKVWNRGYVYNTAHLGKSEIQSFIGGDSVSNWVEFTLDETCYLNFYHNNVIAEIIDNRVLPIVITSSNDTYEGQLQAQLQPGKYLIHFSSESSLKELFTTSIYLSNSDPNYSD